MTLEIKVPHLKGLKGGLEPENRQGSGRTFTLHHTKLKSTHLPSIIGRFHINLAMLLVEKEDTKFLIKFRIW